MLEQIKNALVRSFVGAIAIGWLFANAVLHFIAGITAPLTMLMRERLQQQPEALYRPTPIPLQVVVPQWISAALLLLVGYLLLRWLYIEPSTAKRVSEEDA